jgi:hypothetical protein
MAEGLQLLRTISPRLRGKQFSRWVTPILVVTTLVYGWKVNQGGDAPPENTLDGLKADRGAYPTAMAARLRELALSGRVFNDYNHGGFLHLAVGPGWLVGMDGRNDLFGEAAVRRYEGMVTGRDLALPILDADGVDAVLLSWPIALTVGGMYEQLAMEPGWALVGFDDAALLMIRRKSFAPEAIARMELRHYVPTIPWKQNVSRARAARTLPQMRSELEALARSAPSYSALTAAAMAAESVGDRTVAAELLKTRDELIGRTTWKP